ncbi:MAG: ubiquinone/menaquinone biosynthesis methyltransferase [Chloroflexi bacterium]|jgi:demethylmenaquinone methyltransferase / 2-methoxy-6-polyprenyl-1,4-benzoquinol methylase|nr:ubiquinone/menaquinone biosynthesis methyltransferase [Chloroflexota bacterium]
MSSSIQNIYTKVPRTYEFLNHLLTFGQDIIWRKKTARIAASAGGNRWLDACGGTGETAGYLSELSPDSTSIVIADFSLPMILEAMKKPKLKRIQFALSDASRLPFQDGSFDLITISFATRNINTSKANLLKCLGEFHRVLKPGGVLVNLETSQPRSRLIRRLFHSYVKLTVRPIGQMISGSNTAYAFLSHTIRRFYSAEELAEIIREAGFPEVSINYMFLGVAAIHKAEKR